MSKYAEIAMTKIKTMRVERKIKQEDLAKILGITYQAYAHYEKGRREPDIDVLIHLAHYFEISLNDLFELK